jgi:uncharacterized surface protein with fasciclin (FAS1) repeats
MIPTRVDGSRLNVEYGKFVGVITPNNNPVLNYLGNLTYQGVQTLNLGVNANIYYTQGIQVLNNATAELFLEGFYVNGARVVEFDAFEGADGVVHKINRVLIPPSGSAAKAIESDPDLSLFNKLVRKASVNANGIPSFALSVLDVLPADALTTARTGTLTVLAPTNAAMTAAGFTDAGIDALTVAQCNTIARQHVIGARWFSSDLSNLLVRNSPFLTTVAFTPLAGANITFNAPSLPAFFSTPTVANSAIVATDVVTANGVIHKIGTVLQ